MGSETCGEVVEAYALGALEPAEAAAFAAHLGSCHGCRAAVDGHRGSLARLVPPAPLPALVREQVLDLADAPRAPVDTSAYEWAEPVRGVKIAVLSDDPARGVRKCLAWGMPGARHPRHRHHGEELILVLAGALGDHRGRYGPGDLCRSRTGSVHTETVLDEGECVCFVVYYGELEMLE